MKIRTFQTSDLPVLIDLTIETFRALFEDDLPDLISPDVFAHDHADWKNDYRREVPTLHDPDRNKFVIIAEDEGHILGYLGWNLDPSGSGRLEMVAVHPRAQRRGVATALCRQAVDELGRHGAAVVHIGTGGDSFHAPARRLYESLGFIGYPVVDYTKALYPTAGADE